MTRMTLIGALVLGAALRAVALPLPGSVDTGSWKTWSFVGSTDPAGLYGVGGSPPERRLLKWSGIEGTTEYPPLTLYELAVVGRIYWKIDPLYADSPALNALIKAPGTLAEVLFVFVLLTWGRRRFGEAAVWTALAFWLNPAVVLNGPVLGYLDPQMAVPAALAFLAAAAGHPVAAGALAACAVLTKAQALFVLPALALFIWRGVPSSGTRALLGGVSGGAVATALILLPIVLRGAFANMVQAVGRLAAHDMLSGYALNIWWIATWAARVRAVVDEWGWWRALTMDVRILRITDWMRFYPNPKPFASAVVLAAIGWACWRARRGLSIGHAAFLAAWCVYVYTMLSVQVHENHLYLAIPFVVIAGGFEPRLRRVAWAISLMAAVNMYLFYGFGDGWPPVIGRRWTQIDLSVLLAFVNLGVFAWATRALLAATGHDTVETVR
jgi:hypothetical protein